MAEGENLLPEEKLLRVIQGKGPAPDKAASAPPAAAPAPAPAPVVAAPKTPAPAAKPAAAPAEEAGRSRLRVAPSAPAAATKGDVLIADDSESPTTVAADDAVADSADGSAALAAGVAPAAGAQPAQRRAGKKRSDPHVVVRVWNRALAAAVLVIVALVAYEIHANVTPRAPVPARAVELALPPSPSGGDVPPLDVLIGLVETNRWFPSATGPGPGPGTTNNPVKPVPVDLKLVGLSTRPDGAREAIVVDSTVGKVHFLKVGDRMVSGQKESPKEFSVVQIERDHVILSSGAEKLILK